MKCNMCGNEFEQEELNVFSVCPPCVSKQLRENEKAIAYAESPEGLRERQELIDSFMTSVREQCPDFPPTTD